MSCKFSYIRHVVDLLYLDTTFFDIIYAYKYQLATEIIIWVTFKFKIQFVMFICGHPETPSDPAPLSISGIHRSTSHTSIITTRSGLDPAVPSKRRLRGSRQLAPGQSRITWESRKRLHESFPEIEGCNVQNRRKLKCPDISSERLRVYRDRGLAWDYWKSRLRYVYRAGFSNALIGPR